MLRRNNNSNKYIIIYMLLETDLLIALQKAPYVGFDMLGLPLTFERGGYVNYTHIRMCEKKIFSMFITFYLLSAKICNVFTTINNCP